MGVVGVKGHKSGPRRFGSQGEGAIEGPFTAYMLADLHDHGGFAYSMWEGCDPAAVPAGGGLGEPLFL